MPLEDRELSHATVLSGVVLLLLVLVVLVVVVVLLVGLGS